MYKKSAKFYDALYHFRDYATASESLYMEISVLNPSAKTLLDTACGTGKHIEHIKNYFECEGLDINEELLEIAKHRCPGNKFHQESMIDFNLGKKYDVITCLFGSIAYVKTLENLYKAFESMSRHLDKDGLIIIEPWFSKQQYWVNRVTANHFDEKDLKITWMYVSKLVGDNAILDINYLVGTPEEVTYFSEKHELGLFTSHEYENAMTSAGFRVIHKDEGLFGKGVGNGLYVGIKK